jgi:preprotein translocase subunit SecA
MVDDLDKMVQRPLHYAIVDEVDSVLIDEARTPLIISAPADEATDKYYEFARLAARLKLEEHYTLDEKMKAASLTDEGIHVVEQAIGVENVYEAGRIDDVHHIENALRAVALYHRDRDYVSREGEIIIVDEFTGRLMPGRRWSDGLHQAIEAKEGVKIQQESMTLATITFQNYFRLYKKLSGMTGTAATEAEEFMKIYGLEVVKVPTNMPMVRADLPDRIYKTEAGKFRSVARDVAERHAKGQPVLIGTVSIAKNELMSGYLNDLGVPHKLLNAKNNESEAATVAAAGQPGAVTLATNIAGRGTDIMLGEGVADVGGLHVMGTERHESRRIDNQLRGRSGRQGDAGSSQFYVSLEDDLMRIFGSDRLAGMLSTLGMDDDTPIEHKFISSSLESAQKKVEGHNFDSRKQVVEFDDVMNRHRESVYGKRRAALAATEGLREEIEGMLEEQLRAVVAAHTNQATGEMDLEGLREALGNILPLTDEMWQQVERAHPSEIAGLTMDEAHRVYDAREQDFTPETTRIVERFVYLSALDRLWINHLEAMESLREGIFLRSIGQRDPLTEYKREGFRMYKQLLGLFDAEVATNIFRVQISRETAPAEAPVETALTRAAEHARSNAPLEGAEDGSNGGRSRAERRSAVKPVPVARTFTGSSATKQTNVKRKKKRK